MDSLDLNSLLTAAAGYFGNQQQTTAQLQLAKINGATQQATTAQTLAAQTTASQWIPGVSNGLVIIGGISLIGLGLVALVMSSRK